MRSYRYIFDTSQTARANGRRQKQVCPGSPKLQVGQDQRLRP